MADSKPNAVDPAGELFDVKGLIVVITGGGTGIGKMFATALENNGAIVYIVGRRLEALEKTAEEINKFGNIIPVQTDITDNDSIKALASKIESDRGYINLLINNAGVCLNMIPRKLPTDIRELQAALWESGSPEEFDSTSRVNIRAPYYTTIAFLHLLHEGNKHSIPRGITSQVITISSIAGLRRDEGVLSFSYGASKAAAIHLAKSFTNLLNPHQIRSNTICPGLFPSEMTAGVLSPDQGFVQGIPVKRLGGLDDMAGLILFMASKAGSYHNGAVQLTDGGRLSLFPSVW